MDDNQKKIREELAKVSDSKFAKLSDKQLAQYDNMSGEEGSNRARLQAQDPNWKNAQLVGTRKGHSGEEYLKKHNEIMKKEETRSAIKKSMVEKRTKDSDWHKNQTAAAKKTLKKVMEDPAWREKMMKGFDRRGKDTNWKENVNTAAAKRRKPIMTPDGEFDGKVSACNHWMTSYGLTRYQFNGLMKRNPDKFYYIET